MCGLAGYITKKDNTLTKKQRQQRNNIVCALHVGMQSRGTDSAGIAGVTKKQTLLLKDSIASSELLKNPGYSQLLAKNPHIAITHTRWATHGAITPENAHPFSKGSILGAHNGQVSNWNDFPKDIEVDSEVIFELLNLRQNNYAKVFDKLEGSMAVTWIDALENDTLYMVRHNNPLYVAKIASLETLFWCSEELCLAIALAGAGITEPVERWQLKEDYVYKVNGKLEITKEKVTFKPTVYVSTFTGTGYKWSSDTKYLGSGKSWEKELAEDDFDEAAETEKYAEVEALAWQHDNVGCEMCSTMVTKHFGFYWNKTDFTILCSPCQNDANFAEYEYMSRAEYTSLIWEDEEPRSIQANEIVKERIDTV